MPGWTLPAAAAAAAEKHGQPELRVACTTSLAHVSAVLPRLLGQYEPLRGPVWQHTASHPGQAQLCRRM